MPPHHGGGRDDLRRLPPTWPDAREQYPEQPIDRTEARSFRRGAVQHGKLMAECENLGREVELRTGRGSKHGQQGEEQRSHPARERQQSLARNNGHNRYGYSLGTRDRSLDSHVFAFLARRLTNAPGRVPTQESRVDDRRRPDDHLAEPRTGTKDPDAWLGRLLGRLNG